MREARRAMMGAIGIGVAAALCAGDALAGAPALANAAVGGGAPALANAALGGGGTQFRGHTTVRTFPCRPGRLYGNRSSGNDFVYRSRGFLGGGIRYKSHVKVPLGTYTGVCVNGIYPWYYYPYFTYGGWHSTYTGGPLYEVDRLVGEQSPTVIVVVQPKTDEALEALQAGKFATARLLYLARAEERRQAEEDGEETRVDRTALRLAALAAAGEGRYPEADRLFAEAYEEDPLLEQRPMEGATLVGGTRQMREILNGAVAYAYKAGTPSAWKMVAWLMQGEGRYERARAMMARAEEIAARSDAVESDPERFAAVER